MKVKVLRPFLDKGNRIVQEGNVIEVSDTRAVELEKKGLIVPTIGGKSGASDPFPVRLGGGPIGAAKVLPLSQVDPQPEPMTSTSLNKSTKRGRQRSSQ